MKSVPIALFACAGLAVAAWFATDLSRAGTFAVPGSLLAFYLPAALAAVAYSHREGTLREWLRPRWGDISVGMLSGVLAFAAAWAVVHVLAPQGSPRESWTARAYLQLGLPMTLRAQSPIITLSIACIAFCDAVVFRGWLPTYLAPLVGSRRAWLLAALLSGLALLPTAYTLRDPLAGWNPLIVIIGLLAALIWNGVTRIKESVIPSVFAQIVFLWTAVMLFRLWGPGL